jgi:alginate O-acetyltransferase complex protein AlgI
LARWVSAITVRQRRGTVEFMLFNSYEFIFLFLPASLVAYFGLGWLGRTGAAIASLVIASLFFYAWWNPDYLLLLLASIGFNYFVGRRLSASAQSVAADRPLLAFGIACNLTLLAWYKYFGFAVNSGNALFGWKLPALDIVLPLGISFFTFTQIAYLVDAYRKEVREYHPLNYLLFVTFFPHLIAGPVLHHAEIMPQFRERRVFRFDAEDVAVGSTIFVIGLFKKVLLADNVAIYSTPVFSAAASGQSLSALEAWGGGLAYAFQIYFDFSGYSDMAVGLARLFGIVFPANFNSPYKALSIIEFWRRWHMTLSRFLRDYLYIPLGGGRGTPLQRYRNLFVTMLLGGLWHGAGWTFVFWGALHGVFLVVNHIWRQKVVLDPSNRPKWLQLFARFNAGLLTFLCVVVAWVFFRAESWQVAWAMIGSMAGQHGLAATTGNFHGVEEAGMLFACAFVVWFLPNVQDMMAAHRPVLEVYRLAVRGVRHLAWRASTRWAMLTSAMFVISLINMTKISEFLYFQF